MTKEGKIKKMAAKVGVCKHCSSYKHATGKHSDTNTAYIKMSKGKVYNK